ncbi:MAG: YD repeat-containing protein [Myxococcota bacterium]
MSPTTALVLALFAGTAAASGDDDAIFLGLSAAGDGVTPTVAEALAHDSGLQGVGYGASGSARGDVSYAVPIALPEGRLGPGVALAYSSAAGAHSPLGRGWSIAAGMTLTHVTGKARAQAYGLELTAPVRVSGGGLSGILFKGDTGWELHSESPQNADVSFHPGDNAWTVRSGGITTTLVAYDDADAWAAHSVADSWGNQVVYHRGGDGVLERVEWGGTQGAMPGEWEDAPLYALVSDIEDAPHVSYRGLPSGGVAVLDRRVVGFTLDTEVACTDASVDCTSMVSPAWDLCYAPFGSEERLVEVRQRSAAHPASCGYTEGPEVMTLAAFHYTAFEPEGHLYGEQPGPGLLGLRSTGRDGETYQWVDMADANGDGWVDRLDWGDDGPLAHAHVAHGGGSLWLSDLPEPFDRPEPTHKLGASKSAVVGIDYAPTFPNGTLPIRNNYTTQTWVDLDGDGLRDLIVAREDVVSAVYDHDLEDVPELFNLNLDEDGIARTWTWDVHFGTQWGLGPAVPLSTPFKFPGVAEGISFRPVFLRDDTSPFVDLEHAGADLLQLVDLTGDGWLDIVYGLPMGLQVYAFDPDRDAWEDAPTEYSFDGIPTSHLSVVTHRAILEGVFYEDTGYYEQPRTEYTEITRRIVDLNGDGHADVVDTAHWAPDHPEWDVAFGYPGGFADAVLWPAPTPWLSRSYEGRPQSSRCSGPPVEVDLGGLDTYVPPTMYDGLGILPDLYEPGGAFIPEYSWDSYHEESCPEDDPADHADDPDFDDDEPACGDPPDFDDGPLDLESPWDPGDPGTAPGIADRVSACRTDAEADPARVLVDLLDLDADGRPDLVDADNHLWYQNTGDGFTVATPIPWDAFPDELGKTAAYTSTVFVPPSREVDKRLVDPVLHPGTEVQVLGAVRDVNGDRMPDILAEDRFILSSGTPPGLLDRVVWGTGAVTSLTYANTADEAGAVDAEPFSSHRPTLRTLNLYDPVTDQSAERWFSYAGPAEAGGVFEGFEWVTETEYVRDGKTRWAGGDAAWPTWSRTQSFTPHRDFPLLDVDELSVETQLRWMPVDGANPAVGAGDGALLEPASRVEHHYEPWDHGYRLSGRLVQTRADNGDWQSMSMRATWTGPDLTEVVTGPTPGGDGPIEPSPETVRVEFADWAATDDGSLRLPGTKKTYGWDEILGAESLAEWVQYQFGGQSAPASGEPFEHGAVVRQDACGAFAGDALCDEAWETWTFTHTAAGAVEETTGPGGAWASTTWTLGGAVVTDTLNAHAHATHVQVDGLGRPLASTGPNGVTKVMAYDGLGRPASESVIGAGLDAPRRVRSWAHAHEDVPRWTEETRYTQEDPLGPVLERAAYQVFDGLGRTQQSWTPEEGPSGFTVRETLTDLAGNAVVVRAPRGADVFEVGTADLSIPDATDTRHYVDAMGVERLAWSPVSGTSRTLLPIPGAVETMDGMGRLHRAQHDLLGRLVAVDQGGPTEWTRTGTYSWDGRDRLTGFTDANGNQYRTTYDQVGRARAVERRPAEDGAPWEPWHRYEHEGPHPVRAFDQADALVVTWEHDALGRLTHKSVLRDGVWEDSSAVWDTAWVGVRSSVTDPLSTTTYAYDAPDGALRWGLGHLVQRTRTWSDGHVAEWAYTPDSDGLVLASDLPGAVHVEHTFGPTRWAEASTAHLPDGTHPTVDFLPGVWGQPSGGWFADVEGENCNLRVDHVWSAPAALDAIKLQRPSCDTNSIDYSWDASGALVSKAYTGFGDVAGVWSYAYDALGRIDDVSQDGEVVESIARDALGLPTSLTRGGAVKPGGDPLAPLPTTWTYAPERRFGEVAGRSGADDDADWIEEQYTWDPMGRLSRVSHLEPTERRNESYLYDGLGRLARIRGVERITDPDSGDVEMVKWTHTFHYDLDDVLITEVRTGASPKVVHRDAGYVADSAAGQTVDVLPMLRAHDGQARWSIREPGGNAAWVLDGSGGEVLHKALGQTGVALHEVGTSWPVDGLHGSQPERFAGVINHGPRHARLDDGLWLQPEPLLHLGLTNADLGAPLGFGPAYAAGNTNALQDRNGYLIETAFDFASLIVGYGSYRENVAQGSYGWAALDAAGMAIDAAAVLAPGVPGGAGIALKAVNKGADLYRTANGADAMHDVQKLAEAGGGACFIDGTTVATPMGVRAIEGVQEGDQVIAAAGEDLPPRCPPSADAMPAMPRTAWERLGVTLACASAPGGGAIATLSPDASVDVYDARLGLWAPAVVSEQEPGAEVRADGQLYRVELGGPVWLGEASAEALMRADASLGDVACWRTPHPEDWVVIVGAGGHAPLDAVAAGAQVALDGQVWAVTPHGVEATGDVLGRVVDTFARVAPEVIDAEVSYGDGTTDVLTGTPNHPFWVDAVRDYVPLGELEVGTVLHVQGGGEAILVNKTWRQGEFEVFDFEVEGLHNFYVRGPGADAVGVLVHNSTAEGSVDLFRAVSTGELDDIATSGVLRGNPTGASLEGKQFGLDLGETVDFADAIGDADAVIKVSVPRSTLDALDQTGVDSAIFRSGTVTAQPGAQLDLVNDTVQSIEIVYP